MRCNRLLGLVSLAMVIASCGFFSDNVEVVGINFYEGDTASLIVASCNGAPVAAVTELERGRYRVETRTTQEWNRGLECADAVEIPVAENLAVITVEDAVSGETFTFPPLDGPGPPSLNIDGTWQMIKVNGAPVEVGVNTIELPKILIEAGFLSGQFGCNDGGAELMQEESRIEGFIESTAELCSIPDGAEQMVPTERILVSMLESGAVVQRLGAEMVWIDDDGNELVFEQVS